MKKNKHSFYIAMILLLTAGSVNMAEEVSFAPAEEEVIFITETDSIKNEAEEISEEETEPEEKGNEEDVPETEISPDVGEETEMEEDYTVNEEEGADTDFFTDEAEEEIPEEVQQKERVRMEIEVCVPSHLYRNDRIFFARIESADRAYTIPFTAGNAGGRLYAALEAQADVYRVFLMQAAGFRISQIEGPDYGYEPLGMPGEGGNAVFLSAGTGTSCTFVLERTQTHRPFSSDFAWIRLERGPENP